MQRQTGLWVERPTPDEARAMLAAVIDDVLLTSTPTNCTKNRKKSRKRRDDQLNWLTVLQRIRKHKRASATDSDGEEATPA